MTHRGHTILAGIVFGLMTSGVSADSAEGVDTIQSNALNYQGDLNPEEVLDEKGLSVYTRAPRRSPSGLLYNIPYETPVYRQTENGWRYVGSVEFGVLAVDGDTDNPVFIEYTDWDDGFVFNNFSFAAEKPESGGYFRTNGGGVGRNDQFYAAEGGQYGSWRLKGFYNEIPHVFTTNARTIFDGVGTGNLTLPDMLTPAGSTPDEVRAVLATKPDITSSLQRKRAGLGLDWMWTDTLTFFGDYSFEKRDGTRPFSGGMYWNWLNPAIGGSVEMLEPIDYDTHDILFGLRQIKDAWQLNVVYEGSFFRNEIKTLTWEHPWANGSFAPLPDGASNPETGRFALYPDNDFHHLKLDFAHDIGWEGVWTTQLATGRMEQNDALIPHTVNTGIGGNIVNPIDFDLWNTTAALSQNSADALIDTYLFQTGVNVNPWNKVTLRGKLRYYEEKNETDYTNFNPLTGEFGYIALDGGPGGVVPGASGIFEPGVAGSLWHVRNIPFDYRRGNITLGGDWRYAARGVFTVEYEHENYQRDFRERDETKEDRLRLALSHRGFSKATLRVAWEYAQRDGDPYISDPYDQFWTEVLPGYVPTIPEGTPAQVLDDLRKYDLADRDQQILNARLNFMIRDDMDLFFSGRWQENDYQASYGRRSDEARNFNVEWTWFPSNRGNVYAWYGWQDGDIDMANINDAGPNSIDGSAGGPVYPFDREYTIQQKQETRSFGAGVDYRVRSVDLKLDYIWIDSDTPISYDYASVSSLVSPLSREQTGGSPGTLAFRRQIFQASARWPFARQWAVRFYYRHEEGKTHDWHFDGLERVSDQTLYLGAVPQDYDVDVIGLLLQFRTH